VIPPYAKNAPIAVKDIVSYQGDGKTDDFNYNVVDWWAQGTDRNATISTAAAAHQRREAERIQPALARGVFP
jgi:hypothetical protein